MAYSPSPAYNLLTIKNGAQIADIKAIKSAVADFIGYIVYPLLFGMLTWRRGGDSNPPSYDK